MLFTNNRVLDTDSYKNTHDIPGASMYPPGTEYFSHYFESRGGLYTHTVWFGLQYILKKYLSVKITAEMVEQANKWVNKHIGPDVFNRPGWDRIVNKHGGYFPVIINAAPEGLVIPTHNALFTVENLDPECRMFGSHLETQLTRVWSPTTVATRSWFAKRIIERYLEDTGTPGGIGFALNDFGARGVSSFESAGINGAAHLINFFGSDTQTGAAVLMDFYNHDGKMGVEDDQEVPSYSVRATEHTTIITWGKEHELDAYRNIIEKVAKPGSIVACVSDSYDIFNACRMWGVDLKEQVIKSGATLVIRPDSGDPSTVVLKCAQILEGYFGSTMNVKGYKTLNYVRLIQGDGINENSIRDILQTLKAHGYSADNVVFGMGGALLQQVNRDTQKIAYKCSATKRVGESWKGYSKDPITDPGKRSKEGRLTLIRKANGDYATVTIEQAFGHEKIFRPVWKTGELLVDMTLAEVRANSNLPVKM